MRTYTGAKRKRNETPASRRRRAVAYRHIKYIPKAIRKDLPAEQILPEEIIPAAEPEQIEEPVTEPVAEPAEEPVQEPAPEPEAEPAVEPESEPVQEPAGEAETAVIAEPVPEPKPVKTAAEKRAERKARKLQAREDAIEDWIRTPRTGFFRKIISPYLAIVRESSVKENVSAPAFSFVVTLFRFIAAGAFVSRILAAFINENPFGFARLNFTSGAWLSIRFAIYMIIAQYVLVYLVSAVSYIFREPVSGKKLMAGVSQSSLTIGLLFVLAVLLYGRMPVIAAGIGITAAVMGIFLTFAAISHLFRFEKTGRLLTVILIVAVLSIFGLKYIQFACGDIYRILLNILNI